MKYSSKTTKKAMPKVKGGKGMNPNKIVANPSKAAKTGGILVEKTVPRTPYSVALMGRMGVFGHVGVYHPSGMIYHCLDRQGVSGHSVQTLQCIFADIEYWSVTDDLRCIPPEST